MPISQPMALGYYMAKFYPLQPNQATLFNILEQISHTQTLPKRPYCSDNLSLGIYPRLQRIALAKAYIQLNPPQMQHWLVFDIDRPHSALAWYDANLPVPFAVVVNPNNQHCHVIYRLSNPVCTSDFANEKPLRYLAAIQQAYTEKLQADACYSGLIAKNPFSVTHWNTFYWDVNAIYELSELAEWVDITQASKHAVRASEAFALGRNCYLFDKLRKYAYKAIKDYRGGKVEQWRNHILSKTIELNVFSEPLPVSEVKAIAKSVANGVWQYMRVHRPEFIERQRKRGRNGGLKGGVASGKVRAAKNDNKRMMAILLKKQGISVSEISRILGVSRNTIHNWKLE